MNFRMRQEGLISHIPKALRNMTMRDFAKYDGDIKKAVQGLQAESYGQVEAIDRTTRKRKWIESQEQEAEQHATKAGSNEDGGRAPKNGQSSLYAGYLQLTLGLARMTAPTPKKAPNTASHPARGRFPPPKTPSHVSATHLHSIISITDFFLAD
jgi:hypothetical protein